MSQNNPYVYNAGYSTSQFQAQPPIPQQQQSMTKHNPGGGISGAIHYAVLYVVAIWGVHIINVVFTGGQLTMFGIHPLDTASLWGVFTAPLLHASFEHLISNTIPGAVFAFIIGYSGRQVFWEVTSIVVVVAGLGTWLFGGVGTNHVGASGMVYGWLGYLIIRGIFNRSFRQILLGVVLGFMYSGLVWGLLPFTPGVSWQGHLFGALGGIGAGMFITSDDPPQLQAKKAARRVAKQ